MPKKTKTSKTESQKQKVTDLQDTNTVDKIKMMEEPEEQKEEQEEEIELPDVNIEDELQKIKETKKNGQKKEEQEKEIKIKLETEEKKEDIKKTPEKKKKKSGEISSLLNAAKEEFPKNEEYKVQCYAGTEAEIKKVYAKNKINPEWFQQSDSKNLKASASPKDNKSQEFLIVKEKDKEVVRILKNNDGYHVSIADPTDNAVVQKTLETLGKKGVTNIDMNNPEKYLGADPGVAEKRLDTLFTELAKYNFTHADEPGKQIKFIIPSEKKLQGIFGDKYKDVKAKIDEHVKKSPNLFTSEDKEKERKEQEEKERKEIDKKQNEEEKKKNNQSENIGGEKSGTAYNKLI